MEEIKSLKPKELIEWLKSHHNLDPDILTTLKDAELDGKLFLEINEDDLKDLFKSFITRKILRDIIRGLKEDVNSEEPTSAAIVTKPSTTAKLQQFCFSPTISSRSSTPEASPSWELGSNSLPVPYSPILENPEDYNKKDVDLERVKLIRKAMDSLITNCGGRPNDHEILALAKAMASKYPVLRDAHDGPLRDNYKGLKGFLRRRMYNTTAPETNRGRKRKLEDTYTGNEEAMPNNTKSRKSNAENSRKTLSENATTRDTTDTDNRQTTLDNPCTDTRKAMENIDTRKAMENIDTRKTMENIDTRKATENKDTRKAIENIETRKATENIDSRKAMQNIDTRKATENIDSRKASDKNIENLEDKESVKQAYGNEVVKKKKNDDDESTSSNNRKPQRAEEVLLKKIKQMTKDSNSSDVIQLIKLTLSKRVEECEELPPRSRFDHIRDNYKLFLNSKFILENLILQLPAKVEESDLRKNIAAVTDELVDFICARGLIKYPRSVMKTEDQRIVAAFVHLPTIMGKKSAASEGLGQKLKIHNMLFHVPKTEEVVDDVTKQHKNCNYPWVLYQRIGDNVNFLVFVRDKLYLKAKDAADAILIVMGLFYAAVMPYPTILNAALLYIQDEVLGDNIHDDDKSLLAKARRDLDKFKDEPVQGLEDLF